MAEKITRYNNILQEKSDKFAPLLTKMIKVKPNAPWFDSEYKELRRKRRKAEKRYRKSKAEQDKKQGKKQQSWRKVRKQVKLREKLKKDHRKLSTK